jgi:hypothetical protein
MAAGGPWNLHVTFFLQPAMNEVMSVTATLHTQQETVTPRRGGFRADGQGDDVRSVVRLFRLRDAGGCIGIRGPHEIRSEEDTLAASNSPRLVKGALHYSLEKGELAPVSQPLNSPAVMDSPGIAGMAGSFGE